MERIIRQTAVRISSRSERDGTCPNCGAELEPGAEYCKKWIRSSLRVGPGEVQIFTAVQRAADMPDGHVPPWRRSGIEIPSSLCSWVPRTIESSIEQQPLVLDRGPARESASSRAIILPSGSGCVGINERWAMSVYT